ncbi:Transketolase, pyrimidine binding domain-containing protein [Cladophialophora immunda]|nr:Transketolase, pyrimidine binding domain-containing protein [Cladophialophora immunda]
MHYRETAGSTSGPDVLSKGADAPSGLVNTLSTAIKEDQATSSETNGRHHSLDSDDDVAVLALRNLIFDICNQNGGGHGGSAIGMSAIGVALYKYIMRYNPLDSEWFDRDRFVLSNGHCAMFLYALNHLVGFPNWTMDELKGYGSAKTNGYTTICHAHPEIEVPGVEVTTGPLGQGIANAVGLAIASKNLAARYNEPGLDVVKSRIYCMTGDGCLMEGVALEAISLAGHLQLDNLVLIYDNNAVTCDGPLDWINSEDVNAKMRACGWKVLEIEDGSYDVQRIVQTLRSAGEHRGQPVFVNIRTVIGIGTQVAGTAKAHHGAFDELSVRKSKELAGQDPSTTHQVPPRAMSYFRERQANGEGLQAEWNALLDEYAAKHPKKAADLSERRQGGLGSRWEEVLDGIDSARFRGQATRDSNGAVMEAMWPVCGALFGGGADLVTSNKLYYSRSDVFHPPDGFAGRYIRYGIREHAMASISNGIAAYSPGTFVPITATFFMFYLYAAPGVRMGALSHLQAIHFATHDSFAEGQNGPTHQPVELDSLYRAMPNLQYIRPCDAEEVIGAWKVALAARHTPSMLSLGRDPVVTPVPNTDRTQVARGAYVIHDYPARTARASRCAPCLALFDAQDQTYRDAVFPSGDADGGGDPVVSVEEYVPAAWAKYATASIGVAGFGYSASNPSNYARFGLDDAGIVRRVKAYLADLAAAGCNARMYGWRAI